ncbi:MAG: hypothetical protein P1U90_14860 [Akkermansiaceae bacterium]|nr:hypothetical protein [Akkermansiaceae bacterium]
MQTILLIDDDSAARRLVKKVFEQAELLDSFPSHYLRLVEA